MMAEIECHYCRAMNDGDERRCTRCGRRLLMAAPRPAPDTYPLASGHRGAAAKAAATAPDMAAYPELYPELEKTVTERPTFQPSLFREGLGSPKVIPIPTLTPLRAGRDAAPIRRAAPRTAQPRSRRTSNSQQALDLHDAPNLSSPFTQPSPFTQSEGIICESPVAL